MKRDVSVSPAYQLFINFGSVRSFISHVQGCHCSIELRCNMTLRSVINKTEISPFSPVVPIQTLIMRTFLVVCLVLLTVGCRQPVDAQQQGADAARSDSSPVSLAESTVEDIDQSRRNAITRAVEAAAPAVVSVNVIEIREVRYRDPFSWFDEFVYGERPRDRVYRQRVQGVGSGFLISPDGYIVTNDHVAGNATKVTVAFPDGEQLPAEIVGSDPATDVALLKVDTSDQPYLQFETSETPIVGEWVIALGNPFGLFDAAEPTVTVGVVSATGRNFPSQDGVVFRDMIQTDAAINQGNSGGPLINALGHVIGMNTFIYSRSGGSVGLGFSVPAWRVKEVVDELRENGRVERGNIYIGANVRRVDARIARGLGLSEADGLIVVSVDEGSPAERAGLQPYDVVVSVAGEPVSSNADVNSILFDFESGDSVTIGFLRDGREMEAELVLSSE